VNKLTYKSNPCRKCENKACFENCAKKNNWIRKRDLGLLGGYEKICRVAGSYYPKTHFTKMK